MSSLANIIIVSQDKLFRTFLQRLLERNRYSCRLFEQGFKALESLDPQNPPSTWVPHLIIVDDDLTDLKGSDFCLRLRDKKDFFYTPLFLAYDGRKSTLEEISLRSHYACNSYFQKPPEAAHLLPEIEKSLDKFRIQSGNFQIGNATSSASIVISQDIETIPLKGKISSQTVDVPKLLNYLYSLKTTGRLIIDHEGIKRTISILKGNPILCQSTAFTDRLGQFLLRKKLATEKQIAEALVLDANPDLRLGQSLVKMNVLTPHNLYAVIQEQTKSILFSAFLCHDCTYEFIADETPFYEEIHLNLDFFKLIKEGISSCFDESYILQRLGGKQMVLYPTKRFGPVIMTLHLDPSEMKLSQFINGKLSLEEIFNLSPLSGMEAAQLLYLFYALGAVQVRKP